MTRQRRLPSETLSVQCRIQHRPQGLDHGRRTCSRYPSALDTAVASADHRTRWSPQCCPPSLVGGERPTSPTPPFCNGSGFQHGESCCVTQRGRAYSRNSLKAGELAGFACTHARSTGGDHANANALAGTVPSGAPGALDSLISRPVSSRARLSSKTLRSREHRSLCAVLVASRREAGLTQAQLAERLGKPPSFVAKIEIGDRRLDVVEFTAVAKALKLGPRKMYDRFLNW